MTDVHCFAAAVAVMPAQRSFTTALRALAQQSAKSVCLILAKHFGPRLCNDTFSGVTSGECLP